MSFNGDFDHSDHFNIDIAVNIPCKQNECLTIDDVLGGDYLIKRRMYLSCIYDALSKCNKLGMILFPQKQCKLFIDYLNNDPSKPIICMNPISFCTIRILPTIDMQQLLDSQHETIEDFDDNENQNENQNDNDNLMEMNQSALNNLFFGNNNENTIDENENENENENESDEQQDSDVAGFMEEDDSDDDSDESDNGNNNSNSVVHSRISQNDGGPNDNGDESENENENNSDNDNDNDNEQTTQIDSIAALGMDYDDMAMGFGSISNRNNLFDDDEDGADGDSDVKSDAESVIVNENDFMARLYFGEFYHQWKKTCAQYSTRMSQWSMNKLYRMVYFSNQDDSNSNTNEYQSLKMEEIYLHYIYVQQVLEDVYIKEHFLQFFHACNVNPNLHRALVLIKTWWNQCNFNNFQKQNSTKNVSKNNKKKSKNDKYFNNSRLCDINSFHITMYLLLMYRSYHIDKWDSPLIIFAKFLELVSREEIGSWLCHKPICTIYDEFGGSDEKEQDSSWNFLKYTDSHLFDGRDNTDIINHSDTKSVFNNRYNRSGNNSNSMNANLYDSNYSFSSQSDAFYYSYIIWKTKKKHGICMTNAIVPRTNTKEYSKYKKSKFQSTSDSNWSFDEWSDNALYQPIYMKLLSQHFPIIFCDLNGMVNYTFRVNICNYLHFIQEARRASESLNKLLEEMPFLPNPDTWGYQRAMNPRNFDIVGAALITFHEKCLSELLIAENLNFWLAFDGFITINVQNLIDVCFSFRRGFACARMYFALYVNYNLIRARIKVFFFSVSLLF